MKTTTPLLFFLMFFGNISAQTNIGGVISTNTTLNPAGSPYIVTNNLLVPQGVQLSIEPGVVLKFNALIYIQIDGEIRASGNINQPVIFTDNGSKWAGIRLNDSAIDYNHSTNTGCLFEYCIIENTYDPTGIVRAFQTLLTWPMIRFCEFRQFDNDLAIELNRGGYFINNKVHHGSHQTLVFTGDSAITEISGNEFYNLTPGANNIVDVFNATLKNNYFHDNSGIAAIRSFVYTRIENNLFKNNDMAAILFAGGAGHEIICNTFDNNLINVAITCLRQPVIQHNNFLDYQSYNIQFSQQYWPSGNADCVILPGSGSYENVYLDSNYWGGLSQTQIDSSIWDFNDDFSVQSLTVISHLLQSPSNCATTTVLEPEIKNQFHLFPNPASSFINVNNPFDTQVNLQILDYAGRIIMTKSLLSGSNLLQLPELNEGIYLCKFSDDIKFLSHQKLLITLH
jgi:hypothetical protein